MFRRLYLGLLFVGFFVAEGDARSRDFTWSSRRSGPETRLLRQERARAAASGRQAWNTLSQTPENPLPASRLGVLMRAPKKKKGVKKFLDFRHARKTALNQRLKRREVTKSEEFTKLKVMLENSFQKTEQILREETHTVGELITQIDKLVELIGVVAGSTGALAADLLGVSHNLTALKNSLAGLPLENPVQIFDPEEQGYDFDGGIDFGGIDSADDDSREILPVRAGWAEFCRNFIAQHGRTGCKLLLLTVCVAGTWQFAPLYFPSMVARGAVVAGFSAALSKKPLATALIDGAAVGVASAVPGMFVDPSSVVCTSLSSGSSAAVAALCDGRSSKEVAQRGVLGCVGGALVHGVGAGVRSLVSMFSAPAVQSQLPQCSLADKPFNATVDASVMVDEPFDLEATRLVAHDRAGDVVATAEDLSRAVVPYQPFVYSKPADVVVPRPESVVFPTAPVLNDSSVVLGSCVSRPFFPAQGVVDGLRQRILELEKVVDEQNSLIQKALKPFARKVYDGIKLTQIFDCILDRDSAVRDHVTRCAIDASSVEQLQQCVVDLEQAVADQGVLIQTALKPFAKKAYDGVGLTKFFDYLFKRTPLVEAAVEPCSLAGQELSLCVAQIERTVEVRDAQIAELIKPMARKFYDAIGLTRLVQAFRS